MVRPGSRIFLPGFAARSRTYSDGLPPEWEAPQPPPLAVTGGSLGALRDWALREVTRRPGPAIVAGHSMGAALAVLVAVTVPDRIDGLLLLAPAGLPLRKPIRRSARDLVRQLAARTYPFADVVDSAGELSAAPRGTIRLIRALRRLDLSAQMERVREAGIPTTVVGCTTDTLVTTKQCRTAAGLLGADYRELDLAGGHVWMLARPPLMAAILRGATS